MVPLCSLELHQAGATLDSESQENNHNFQTFGFKEWEKAGGYIGIQGLINLKV